MPLYQQLTAAWAPDRPALTDADVAAFSGYGLAIRSPEVQPIASNEVAELWGIVESRYQDVHAVAPLGQADTRLRQQ